MEPELAAWVQTVVDPMMAWRNAFAAGDVDEVVRAGREFLAAIGAAGPGPVGFEDRVAEVALATARVVVVYRSGEPRDAAAGEMVAALRWLQVPDA